MPASRALPRAKSQAAALASTHTSRRSLAATTSQLEALRNHVTGGKALIEKGVQILRRLRQTLGSGAGLEHFVALGSEADAQEFADLRFVVDDQDPCR